VIAAEQLALADSATNISNYLLSGLSVLSASLDSVARTVVLLGTSAQSSSVNYILTISGVQDRCGNTIATNTSIALDASYSGPIMTAQPQPQSAYAGATVMFTVFLNSLALVLGGIEDWRAVALLNLAAHIPVALIEGVVVGSVVNLVLHVKPELLLRGATSRPNPMITPREKPHPAALPTVPVPS